MDEQQLLMEQQRQQKQTEKAELERSIVNQDADDRRFDNEWIVYISELAKNQSTKDIAAFIEKVNWSYRQKRTIMNYAKIVLGDGLSVSNIEDSNGFMRMKDLKALIDCDLTLGMTTFDLTPEFNILRGLIDFHFELELNKSRGGFIIKRIGTKTYDIQHEERIRNKVPGMKDKITGGI